MDYSKLKQLFVPHLEHLNRIYFEISRTAVSVPRARDQVIFDSGLLTLGPGTRILVFDVTVIIFRLVAHLFRKRMTSRTSHDQINGKEPRPSYYRIALTEHAVFCVQCV